MPNNTKGSNYEKTAAHERAAERGIPYKVALAQLRAEADGLRELPGASVPAPVAIMMARQLNAAMRHLGAFRELTAQYGVTLPMYSREEETHAVALGSKELSHLVFELLDWAGRTAHVSGAVGAAPEFMGPDVAGARAALYPDGAWCAEEGGHMPQPGEQITEHEGVRLKVRTNLAGPVPREPFRAGGDRNPARPAVDGTPADSVWRAYEQLGRFGWHHWERPGDSAADLAATLDGLDAVAGQLSGHCTGVIYEIEQRIADGRLAGVDAAAFAAAVADAHEVPAEDEDGNEIGGYYAGPAYGTIGEVLTAARHLLAGAHSTLPAGPVTFSPRALAALRALNGASLADVRAKLGEVRHLNKQITKVRNTDYGPEKAIARAIAWMHATNVVIYDHARHLADEQAAAALAGGTR